MTPMLALLFAPAGEGGTNMTMYLIQIPLIFGIFYFLMIRPQQKQRQLRSSGPGSERSSARRTLSRPSLVNAVPFLPMRVGATQSKRSTPRRTPSTRSSGKPTPMR